jgi:glucose/arabinose dehydrogenase
MWNTQLIPAALASLVPSAALLLLSPSPSQAACDTALVLPPGFCGTLVSSRAGAVRQLAVAPNGDLYAAVADGEAGVIAFRDRNNDGKPEEKVAFGPGDANDVEIREGHLYLALNDRILRWRLTEGQLKPAGEGQVIVGELPHDGNHKSKSLAFPGDATMYVSIGSATNSCQKTDRLAGSPGQDPCKELERHAGIWRFSADRPGQRFADGERIATGLRNAGALAIQPGTGAFYAAVHGRDQLGDNWGFSNQENAENPAEELVSIQTNDDFGWPYCYYSNQYRKKVLAPEYGGDGRKVGRCAAAKDPVIAFPGHWAPMALTFYSGDAFGPKYKGGLFLAFHGSWNRAPLPQAGYRVVFAPFAQGKATGQYETFATAGSPTGLRATGVAVGTDGSLFISADGNQKIWKVTRAGAGQTETR